MAGEIHLDEPSPDPGGEVLSVRGLRKSYGRDEVLRDVSFTLRAGDVLGFLGRNGAGKTTTFRSLLGMMTIDGGEIALFGERFRHPAPRHKQILGYVSQEQHFYTFMTARRLGRFVSAFYPTWDDDEYRRLLSVFQVPTERKIGVLSHGTTVKLALALALAHRPPVLLLDEPTAGLDPAARREFLQLVAHEASGRDRATVFSSHIVEEIERVANRVAILHRGSVTYEGSLAELRARVRRVRLSPAVETPELPAGLRVLRDARESADPHLFVEGAVSSWADLASPPWSVDLLPLEDVFLEMTSGR